MLDIHVSRSSLYLLSRDIILIQIAYLPRTEKVRQGNCSIAGIASCGYKLYVEDIARPSMKTAVKTVYESCNYNRLYLCYAYIVSVSFPSGWVCGKVTMPANEMRICMYDYTYYYMSRTRISQTLLEKNHDVFVHEDVLFKLSLGWRRYHGQGMITPWGGNDFRITGLLLGNALWWTVDSLTKGQYCGDLTFSFFTSLNKLLNK